MYYNREILAAQQDEFTSLRQGSMTVMDAVKKFEQLARLCPELVLNETEKVRRMMKMFRTDIAKQDKEARAQIFEAKKEEKAGTKQGQQRNYPQKRNNRGKEGNNIDYPVCIKCGRKHPGVCRMGMNACYLCGKEGHYARNCTQNPQNQNPPELFVDLIAIKLKDFDVILGMDFLGKYNAKIVMTKIFTDS
ncbi:hypothetical protein TIFTF001_031364 [Ficus carica]|uniref:CCHC-type domain-containing protein n=1 Tax=Ficus carica TaxID=3494 RepID=A0AA88DV73_FICCA|nr:hypothetical protein TIFTF001_031364 [Ficus carica]